MLPWNYGFHWNLGTMIFMGAFYTVLGIVAATVIRAAARAWRDLRASRVEAVRWDAEFHALPARDRDCRHVLTGEFSRRECANCFDCRKCETHAGMVARHGQPPAGTDDYFGLAYPSDRAYHRGHTWLRREPDGTATVGMDDLCSRVLGEPDSVELPKPGERISVNGIAWRAHKRNIEVRVLSPVDGEVIETGGAERGWYLKVKPDADNDAHLLRGAEVRAWLMRELERLQLALTAEGAAPTLADGGAPVADMSASYPEADWDAVCCHMFLEA
jgi:glycine cleavage system H lipoate-binding protein